MKDFEMASKKAFKKVFPDILVKRCLFHFGQSLFRKFISLVVLVSGRPELILDWTALGPTRNGPGRFRAGPRAARIILSRLESSLFRDQLGPRQTLLIRA